MAERRVSNLGGVSREEFNLQNFKRVVADKRILEAEIERLRKALEFYTYRDYPWKLSPDDTSTVWRDYGKRARKALAGQGDDDG